MIAPDRCAAAGRIIELLGPVVRARLVTPMALGEVGFVGEERLIGEVVAIAADVVTLQVYESTVGIAAGAPLFACGQPLSAELGPGLLGGIFDGLQRPLSALAAIDGDVLRRGRHPPALDRDRRWRFEPRAREGERVAPGAVLGSVAETTAIAHPIIVPQGMAGRVVAMATAGEYRVEDQIATVRSDPGGEAVVTLMSRWPARVPRPYRARLALDVPLITGQRVLDTFFPVPLGGTVGMPGGFGTGKTVMQQQLCKRARADVIVFVGCGERGNEMADVLEELSELEDPRTGRLLRDRTVLIANTSNMPVLAREASIYTAATVAEYYRDMGCDTVLIADSTSRWAEALREVASRTGELPAEEGYPAGLASALAAFYERAGRVRTYAGAEGSVTILGAISPPGGDMTEPVSAHTRRFVRCVWSLDPDLAYARHYPAVSWHDSTSRDAEAIAEWHVANGEPTWASDRESALRLLAEADHLESVAQLVGVQALPDRERILLRTGGLLREAVLQQSSLSARDAYSAPAKQRALLRLVLAVHDRCLELVTAGVSAAAIEAVDLSPASRARDTTPPDGAGEVEVIAQQLLDRLGALR